MSDLANRSAVWHHRDGVVVQDATGRIQSFNPSAVRVLSMSPDQLTGRSSLDPAWAAVTADHKPLNGDDHPAMVALRIQKPVNGVVMGVHTPQRELRWLRVDAYPFDGPDGPLVLTWFSDITAQRKADLALHTAISTLQRAMLPHAPTVPEGVVFAHDYRAASGEHTVGGDFLDIFEIGPKTFGFFVGDVCGHDYQAMAVTALARHTLRTAMMHDIGPAESLLWLHDAILASEEQTFCTAICGDGQRHQNHARQRRSSASSVIASGPPWPGHSRHRPTAWRRRDFPSCLCHHHPALSRGSAGCVHRWFAGLISSPT
jgi:phosphoserine phosphatase RsbU/P